MVRRWLEQRGAEMPPPAWIPKFGVVVDEAACGFLISMAPGVKMIECIAADPKLSKEARGRSIGRLLDVLETLISSHEGPQGARVLAALPEMRLRFFERGYQSHGEYTLFSKTWR